MMAEAMRRWGEALWCGNGRQAPLPQAAGSASNVSGGLYSNTMPSMPGRICASASASSRTSISVVGESSEISTVVMSSSSALNGMKRGSCMAADTALLLTSASNGRCACSVPMQPRSSPSCVRVTKQAPCRGQPGCGFIRRARPPRARAIAARAIGSNTFPGRWGRPRCGNGLASRHAIGWLRGYAPVRPSQCSCFVSSVKARAA